MPYPVGMPDQESKQTTPKGLEIPVPTRDEFIRNLDKIAPEAPQPPKRPSEPDKKP